MIADVVITESAKDRIFELKSKNGDEFLLCVSVVAGGCSGRKYSFAFKPVGGDDFAPVVALLSSSGEDAGQDSERGVGVELNNLIAVDPSCSDLLNGCTIDFERTLASGKFTISSPNVDKLCKCGSSFL